MTFNDLVESCEFPLSEKEKEQLFLMGKTGNVEELFSDLSMDLTYKNVNRAGRLTNAKQIFNVIRVKIKEVKSSLAIAFENLNFLGLNDLRDDQNR